MRNQSYQMFIIYKKENELKNLNGSLIQIPFYEIEVYVKSILIILL